MTVDLSQAMAKLERANDHVRDFGLKWIEFRGTDPYKIVSEFDAETNRTKFMVGTLPELPVSLALIFGDAIHNFRSALDQLAFALYRSANQTDPGTHIYYPIIEDASKYESESERKTKGMPKAFKRRIDAINIHGRGNKWLYALHKLDIMDKHKLLVPVTSVNAGLVIVDDGTSDFARSIRHMTSQKVLVAGDLLLEIAGNPKHNHDLQFTFDIALSEPEDFKGHSIMVFLHLVYGQVRAIIETFEI